MLFNLLVEGYVDEAVAIRLLLHCGHNAGATFGIKGWSYIQQKAAAFDLGCRGQGLLTLVDRMDTREPCPVVVVQTWVPHRNPFHLFRVVVREIESWILADRESVSNFLAIPLAKISMDPEALDDPKRTLINLARGSRKRAIRDALVPVEGASASEGPLYSSEIIRFVAEQWSPERACQHSPGLEKCVARLNELGDENYNGI